MKIHNRHRFGCDVNGRKALPQRCCSSGPWTYSCPCNAKTTCSELGFMKTLRARVQVRLRRLTHCLLTGLTILVTILPAASAQDLRAANGSLLANLSSGQLRSASGSLLFRFEGSEVRDASGRLYLRIDGEDVRNASGSLLGRFDGRDMRDASGRLLGRVEGSDVRDASGRLMGRASGVSGRQAAIYFFFLQ